MPKHLRFAGLQRRTLRAYRQGLDRFMLFAKVEKLPLRTQKQLDVAVGEYLNALFQEGDSLAQGDIYCQGSNDSALACALSSPLPPSSTKTGKEFITPKGRSLSVGNSC